MWGFCGAGHAPEPDLGQSVGAGLPTQQADPGRAQPHPPEIVAMRAAFIVRDVCPRVLMEHRAGPPPLLDDPHRGREMMTMALPPRLACRGSVSQGNRP